MKIYANTSPQYTVADFVDTGLWVQAIAPASIDDYGFVTARLVYYIKVIDINAEDTVTYCRVSADFLDRCKREPTMFLPKRFACLLESYTIPRYDPLGKEYIDIVEPVQCLTLGEIQELGEWL